MAELDAARQTAADEAARQLMATDSGVFEDDDGEVLVESGDQLQDGTGAKGLGRGRSVKMELKKKPKKRKTLQAIVHDYSEDFVIRAWMTIAPEADSLLEHAANHPILHLTAFISVALMVFVIVICLLLGRREGVGLDQLRANVMAFFAERLASFSPPPPPEPTFAITSVTTIAMLVLVVLLLLTLVCAHAWAAGRAEEEGSSPRAAATGQTPGAGRGRSRSPPKKSRPTSPAPSSDARRSRPSTPTPAAARGHWDTDGHDMRLRSGAAKHSDFARWTVDG